MLAGFACILIAAITQGRIDTKVVNGIGFSAFLFWGLALVVILQNFSKILSEELNDTAEKMYREEDFFASVYTNETPYTIEAKLIQAGFAREKKSLHKRRFSWCKDYINYYAVIVKDVDMVAHLTAFLENYRDYLLNKRFSNKNVVFYLVYFCSAVTDEALELFQTAMVNQDVMQDLPSIPVVFVPIVYDTRQGKYIVRALKGGFSMNLFRIALKEFYKLCDLPGLSSRDISKSDLTKK